MQKLKLLRYLVVLPIFLLVGSGFSTLSMADLNDQTNIELGKKLAFDRKKGNCLACHMMDDGESPGNVAPPLLAMKARFPDKDKLKQQIWDARKANPLSMMPPFGPHKILSEEEISQIVEYVHTL